LIAVSTLVITLVARHTIVYLRKRYFKYVREKRASSASRLSSLSNAEPYNSEPSSPVGEGDEQPALKKSTSSGSFTAAAVGEVGTQFYSGRLTSKPSGSVFGRNKAGTAAAAEVQMSPLPPASGSGSRRSVQRQQDPLDTDDTSPAEGYDALAPRPTGPPKLGSSASQPQKSVSETPSEEVVPPAPRRPKSKSKAAGVAPPPISAPTPPKGIRPAQSFEEPTTPDPNISDGADSYSREWLADQITEEGQREQ